MPDPRDEEIARLRAALTQVMQELTIPAAEFVPAIPACWAIIEAALSREAGHVTAEGIEP